MIDNFINRKSSVPEIGMICKKLDCLKSRIIFEQFEGPFDEIRSCKAHFEAIEKYAQEGDNEELLNEAYIFKRYFAFFARFTDFCLLLNNKEYEKSWYRLQDCMDDINLIVNISGRTSELDDMQFLLNNYEGLYPFIYFISDEHIVRKSHCSICGRSMLSVDCPHRKGRLYNGKLATEIVDKADFRAVAIVTNPRDKRLIVKLGENVPVEVLFKKIDEFLGFGLPKLQKFSVRELIKFEKDPVSTKTERNKPCPCGSGQKYKKCCGRQSHRRHAQYTVTKGDIVKLRLVSSHKDTRHNSAQQH